MVYACPCCDRTVIYRREGNGNATDDRPFRCGRCRTSFQYIVERPNKRPQNGGQRTLTVCREQEDFTARELSAIAADDDSANAVDEWLVMRQ